MQIILTLIGLYLLAGALFTPWFMWKGLKKVDPGVEGTDVFFKALIVPGLIVFWVYFLQKWMKANKS